MYTAPRHLERTQRYLNFARQNIAGSDFDRAADALRRAVTHAASAVMAAEGRRAGTRRRLRNALAELVFTGQVPHAHLSTFQRVHRLPGLLKSSPPDRMRRLLRTIRARAARLIRDVAAVVNGTPRRTWADELADPSLISDRPQPAEMHTTVPAHCNNLSLFGHPPGSRLAYVPSVCPNCANLPRPHTSRDLPLPTPTA